MHVATQPWEMKNLKKNEFVVASNFVIHPQILIFSVFKTASLSPYWLQIKLSMSLFFFTYWLFRSICGTGNSSQQTSLQCLWTINMVFSNEDKILMKSLYLKWYTAKRLTKEFPEKSWTERGVNKLLKKLQDTGTVDRRPDSGRPPSARTEENVETINDLVLSQRSNCRPQNCPWDITGDGYSSLHSKCNLFAFSSISAEYFAENLNM